MRTIFLAFALLFSTQAFAVGGPWNVQYQNIKLPSQVVMEHRQWALPLGSSSGYFKTGASVSSSSGATITSFLHSGAPDFTRNVTITPTGTTANVGAGTAVVSGTNIFGKSISENFAISSAQSSATTGTKAFRTITSVTIPKASDVGVTVSIGMGSALGRMHCSDNAGDYVFSEYGGVYESTRGTMAASATSVESNLFTPTGTLDGAHNIDLFSVQNYRCFGGQ